MPERDYRILQLQITVLSPLHIGTGRELLKEYDYAVHRGRTWRINEDVLLDAQDVRDARIASILARTPPAQLLKSQDFAPDSPYFRYVLRGTPKSRDKGAVLREQIKDAFDRPYLPGTTLKGALRTALAWHLWQEKRFRPRLSNLSNRPKFAASDYEKELFGPNPNRDLLRALHVSDSAPLRIEDLMLVNARVLTPGKKAGAPIELEAIRRDTVIHTQIKLDTVLFSDWAKEHGLELRYPDALMQFAEIARRHSRKAIERELAWAQRLPDGRHIVSHYKTMQKFMLAPNQFFLQLGWGGGWAQKTFGDNLKQDEAFMEGILKSKRDGGYDVARGHMPSDVQDFPVSRRIAMAYQRNHQGEVVKEIPALPLGWVLISVKN